MAGRAIGAVGWTAPALLFLASISARAQPDACAGVSCADHGQCLLERGVPLCLCDEGYAARALACEPARDAPRSPGDEWVLGARIVRLALIENERGPTSVGAERTADPQPLRAYVRAGEMWCSDFVSWIYRAAGAPFTGGYEGGWLLTNNRAIRAWFERRGLWVERGAAGWRELAPQPGDYVRMHTRSGHGHSGIVRYVSGTALYTIEGNVGQRVRLRRYANYREDPRFDGFGIVALAEPRRAELRRVAARAELAKPAR